MCRNNKPFLLLFTFFIPLWAYSQKPIKIIENQIKFNHGEYSGLILFIPEANYADAEKLWIKKIERGTKSPSTVENGELSLFGAQINEIYEAPINIYSKSRVTDTAVIYEVVFEIKPKLYAGSAGTEKELYQVKKYLFDFGRELYSDMAKEQMRTEDKKLNDLEQTLDSYISEKAKLEKSIINCNNNILEYKSNIEDINKELITINDRLNGEKIALSLLTDEEAIKIKKGEIKDIEKEKDKKSNDIADFENKIVNKNTEIEKAKIDIASNLMEQERVKGELEVQKPLTLAAQQKYNTIVNSTL